MNTEEQARAIRDLRKLVKGAEQRADMYDAKFSEAVDDWHDLNERYVALQARMEYAKGLLRDLHRVCYACAERPRDQEPCVIAAFLAEAKL